MEISQYFPPGNDGVVTDNVEVSHSVKPAGFTLYQNYPNPFNPTTTITYAIPASSFSQKGERGGFITLKVYNLLGQEIATLFEGIRQAGIYSETFDGTGLVSGIYFYRLQTRQIGQQNDGQVNNFINVKKFILLK